VIAVEIVTTVDDELCAAVAGLIPQLSRSSPAPGAEVLGRIVSDESTILFVARLEGVIVGMLTLASFQIPTGVRGRGGPRPGCSSGAGPGRARRSSPAWFAHRRPDVTTGP
jgi:hypothetical protein